MQGGLVCEAGVAPFQQLSGTLCYYGESESELALVRGCEVGVAAYQQLSGILCYYDDSESELALDRGFEVGWLPTSDFLALVLLRRF